MKSLKSCLLTVVLLTLAITAWADGEPGLYELGQLVVTAERYPYMVSPLFARAYYEK